MLTTIRCTMRDFASMGPRSSRKNTTECITQWRKSRSSRERMWKEGALACCRIKHGWGCGARPSPTRTEASVSNCTCKRKAGHGRKSVIARVEIHFDGQVVSGVWLPFPIRADDANIYAKFVLLENSVQLRFRIVFEYFVDILDRIKNDAPLRKRHYRLIFLRPVYRRVRLKPYNEIIAYFFCFLEHH